MAFFVFMKKEIIISKDGSHTLFVPELNETYHSTHGAHQEAVHVFIKSGLEYLKEKKEINVYEIGFGTGLNAFLTAIYAIENKTKINYQTIEAFPLDVTITSKLNYIESVDEKFKSIFSKLHETEWGNWIDVNQYYTFKKMHQKLENTLSLDKKADIVFFDAFAPNHQEELWTVESLSKVANCTNEGGVFVTYCSQGQFRRNLKEAGFEVSKITGPSGKREMVRAFKI